jgi:hypothetical protein
MESDRSERERTFIISSVEATPRSETDIDFKLTEIGTAAAAKEESKTPDDTELEPQSEVLAPTDADSTTASSQESVVKRAKEIKNPHKYGVNRAEETETRSQISGEEGLESKFIKTKGDDDVGEETGATTDQEKLSYTKLDAKDREPVRQSDTAKSDTVGGDRDDGNDNDRKRDVNSSDRKPADTSTLDARGRLVSDSRETLNDKRHDDKEDDNDGNDDKATSGMSSVQRESPSVEIPVDRNRTVSKPWENHFPNKDNSFNNNDDNNDGDDDVDDKENGVVRHLGERLPSESHFVLVDERNNNNTHNNANDDERDEKALGEKLPSESHFVHVDDSDVSRYLDGRDPSVDSSATRRDCEQYGSNIDQPQYGSIRHQYQTSGDHQLPIDSRLPPNDSRIHFAPHDGSREQRQHGSGSRGQEQQQHLPWDDHLKRVYQMVYGNETGLNSSNGDRNERTAENQNRRNQFDNKSTYATTPRWEFSGSPRPLPADRHPPPDLKRILSDPSFRRKALAGSDHYRRLNTDPGNTLTNSRRRSSRS